MPKLFSNLPDEFEQYNPDNSYLDFVKDFATYDENGLLHSYDDEPSSLKIDRYGYKTFTWHSHGDLQRNDKPAYVQINNFLYNTFDSDGRSHSFNGMPSKISIQDDEVLMEWTEHGIPHRLDDKPAFLAKGPKSNPRYIYYNMGKTHRANNQPALANEKHTLWQVEGFNHNATGPSRIGLNKDEYIKPKIWHLYDVHLQEETFLAIKNFEAEKAVPLWVAFLYILHVIQDEEVNLFLDESSAWNNIFPVKWILRSWGITDKNYNERIVKLHANEWLVDQRISTLETLLTIVENAENSN